MPLGDRAAVRLRCVNAVLGEPLRDERSFLKRQKALCIKGILGLNFLPESADILPILAMLVALVYRSDRRGKPLPVSPISFPHLSSKGG